MIQNRWEGPCDWGLTKTRTVEEVRGSGRVRVRRWTEGKRFQSWCVSGWGSVKVKNKSGELTDRGRGRFEECDLTWQDTVRSLVFTTQGGVGKGDRRDRLRGWGGRRGGIVTVGRSVYRELGVLSQGSGSNLVRDSRDTTSHETSHCGQIHRRRGWDWQSGKSCCVPGKLESQGSRVVLRDGYPWSTRQWQQTCSSLFTLVVLWCIRELHKKTRYKPPIYFSSSRGLRLSGWHDIWQVDNLGLNI